MSKRSSPVPRTCEACGTGFVIKLSAVKRGKGRFCSRACAAPNQRSSHAPFAERWAAGADRSNPDACWLWTKGKSKAGYGMIMRDMKRGREYAHRIAYELHYGVSADGLDVCHRCDTPACVNPTHLFLGTATDNLRDMARKGRNDGPAPKLTAKQVREIRALRGSLSQMAIAMRFGVSASAVYKIFHGKLRRHDVAYNNGSKYGDF